MIVNMIKSNNQDNKKKEALEIINWLQTKLKSDDIKNNFNKNFFANYYSNDYDLKDYKKYYDTNDIDEKLNKSNNDIVKKIIPKLNDQYVKETLDNNKFLRHMVQSADLYTNLDNKEEFKVMVFESGTNIAHSSYLFKKLIDETEKNKYNITTSPEIDDKLFDDIKKGNYKKLNELIDYNINYSIFSKENKNNFYKFCKENSY